MVGLPSRATATAPDLSDARRVAVDAAEVAGALLRDSACGPLGTRTKGTNGDVVTDLDLAAERLILDRIRTAFPDHQILSEEAGLQAGDGAWVWVVDPLDGTNNIAVGLSDYVVGIALAANRIPVLGVVHDPVRGQTYSAVHGRGARGPGDALLRASARPAPHGPVLAWIQGHAVGPDDPTARSLKLVMESAARRVFQLWSPLLSWIMLARGDIDGIVGYHTETVDLPAGLKIALEAGVAVHALDGSPFDERIGPAAGDHSFVAAPPERIGKLTELVAAAARLRPHVTDLPVPARSAW